MKTKALSIVIVLSLVCVGLLPKAQAVSPPPDGGYPYGNTAEGDFALNNLKDGTFNTATGFLALFSNYNGNYNTACGAEALFGNTYGDDNTALGFAALLNNTGSAFFRNGRDNTAVGVYALYSNKTGSDNTAIGAYALLRNQYDYNTAVGFAALQNSGGAGVGQNTAVGVEALYNNTGSVNTAVGYQALYNNMDGGDSNTAVGDFALFNNAECNNTAIGSEALISNTTGGNNTATGVFALANNRIGFNNLAEGFSALVFNTDGHNNTAAGVQSLENNTTGSFNIGLGNLAGRNLTTGSNNIDIGNEGVAGEAQTIRIGEQGNQNRTFMAGIFGSTVANGIRVFVNSNGRLGTVPSSQRFKDDIKSMDKASEAILALKPVTFRYKKEIDPQGIPQFGLLAEQVEKVDPDLVARDEQGKGYSVRYDAVNAMLLNEFLKAHSKMEEHETTIARLQKQIEALTTGLQKVSAQLEASKPAPQMVNNP